MRKIAVFTGTRAEYGLLYWIIKALQESSSVELQLLVGGMHLSPEFGSTINQIKDDGFKITEKMEFLLSSDTEVGVTKSMGLALLSAAEVLDRQKPDLLVLLGDRFEALAVSLAAMINRTPIAHIHGGESTEGAIDEAARHSITKMSHLHFPATEIYKKRIIQLGEQPHRVFNFGAPGIDNIKKLELIERSCISPAVGFDLQDKYFLVTYHPVTLDAEGALHSLLNLLDVLDEYPDYSLVITYPNADTHGRKLIDALERYKSQNSHRVLLAQSLGQLRYLSLMKYCEAVIGNSSSGLIEAPTFKVPTVNIGNRQKGRVHGDTVINCGESKEEIEDAMSVALSKEFKERCKVSTNPYGEGEASERIVEKLIYADLDNIIYKSFYDFGEGT